MLFRSSRHDNIYLGFVGLTRDLGRWSGAQFTGSLEYTYIRDEADIQVFNYARNIVAAVFRAGF